VLETAHHLSLSWATRIQCGPSHPICLKSISILSFHTLIFPTSSPTVSSSTGRTERHHSTIYRQTDRRTIPATTHLASTHCTVPQMMWHALAARSRPTLTEFNRTAQQLPEAMTTYGEEGTWPDNSLVEGVQTLPQILELSFRLQPSYPEQWVTDRTALNLDILGE
jgi:hypothetical protein